MTWSTNQVDAWHKKIFSWSTKKAAEKRLHKASISLREKKKQKTKSSSQEKLSGSGTSLHQTQKGITAKASSPAERRESARSMGSSDTKSAVALEPCADLTSPAVPQAQATSTASVASARRLPGKAEAATWLSRRASLAKTSRDTATTSKLKQERELLSPSLSVSGSKSAIAGRPLPPLEKGMSSIARGEDGAEKVGTPENYGAEAKATSKQSKSRASSTGNRRPSTVIANQSQEENTERMTMAEAGTIRTKKLKADIQTDVSDSGGSTKAEGPPKEDLFGSAPGSPYVTPSPSAISAAGEGKPSKISIASKACNDALKAASTESSSTDENEQVSKLTPEAEPKEEGDVSVAVAMVAVEEPDTDSKQDMNEILRELEKQTTVIYPESNLVVVIGILCILWICLLLFLTSHKYTSKTTIWPTSAFPTWPPYHSSTVRPSVVPRSHVYICSTDFCVKEGEHIAGLFSRDVSPCDNFYRYVCRHWERIMYNSAMGIGVATSIDTLLQDAMHTEVLEYILDSSHDDVSEAKRLYEACAAPHTSSSVTELRHILSMWPPIGQWPVNSKGTVSEFDVWSVAARLSREFGLAALLGVEAALDKTFGKHVIELQLPQPLFFRDDEQRKAIVSMFRGAITESAQLTQSSGMVYELMSDIMAVFKSIAKRRPIFPGMEVKLVTVNNLDSGIRTFLTVVFEGTLEGNATVQYRNTIYFEHELSELFREVGPRALINYLGFRLLVRLAPFLPETTNLLRLHSIESVGRVLSPMAKWVLCLRAVALVLPVCVVKAHARLTIVGGSDLTNRAWLSQLESLFFRSSRNYAWMDSLTHRVTRFMLRRVRLARFYPQWSLKRDTCAGGALPPSGGPIHMLHEASRLYQNQRLAQFTRRTRPRDVGDAFGILARFNPGQQAVYVPFGIVNTTVPGNGTVFAFELSRMATRLFAGLVPVVLEDGVADESALLTFTDAAVRKLDQLLDCLTRDYRNLPLPLREGSDDSFVNADRARYVLLAQTAAVVLAHAAFQELLHVKRIWKYDFRLAPLPDLTSEQLFFAYFARDNCECSDDAHKAHDYVINARLPPEQRVNFALRHLPAFGEAFHCSRDAPMRPLEGSVCRVFDYLPSYLPDV
ncbi:membrane metallo-endopeptidase-like 1 [Rhipicephalus microplus]|uniref:membrane metallo-endopeptidase-like 1 n=1 Tax=Rhipicephalus microplus TaxID=6941 RepID=UPI003F6BBE90